MFKRLFGGNKTPPNPFTVLTYEQLTDKSVAAIRDYATALLEAGPTTVQNWQDISRRLIDIAYFDENVSFEDRVVAEKLESGLWTDIKSAMQSDPSALKAREAARSAHIEHGRVGGVFSLMHKITRTNPEDVFDEIVKIENAKLLKDFPREPLESQRGTLIQALLLSRARSALTCPWSFGKDGAVESTKSTNAVVAAGWLVLTRDPTALWIFTKHERDILGHWLDNYAAARDLLKSLGVGRTSVPLIFSSEPAALSTNQMILQSCGDGTTRIDDPTAASLVPELGAFDLEMRKRFLTCVFCLRLWIWKHTLSGIYGAAFYQRVKDAVSDAAWPAATASTVEGIDTMYQLSFGDDKETTGIHNFLVSGLALDFLDRAKPAEVQNQTVQNCAVIFKDELFHFSHYVRFLLSFLVHGEAGSDQAYREDSLE